MARKYLIETYGCQMNVHDSERMAGLLEQAGFEATSDAADADFVVINTCSVRERAEEKLYTRLGELRELGAVVGVNASIQSLLWLAELLFRIALVMTLFSGTDYVRRTKKMLLESPAI